MSQSVCDHHKRRNWLCEQLDLDSVVILVGNKEQVRNKNIHYRFRQDHDFYYYTGFAEPDALAVIRPGHQHQYVLFVQPKDELQEAWFAPRTGVEGAIERFDADLAFPVSEIASQLPKLFENRSKLYLADVMGRFKDQAYDWLDGQRKSVKFDEVKLYRSLHSALPLTQARRPVKDTAELACIRRAVEASVAGHRHLMRICRPGLTEQQMASEFYNQISAHGGNDVGYPTILAGGNNACCLHYDLNQGTLKDGDLVLVDAGGECDYYTADITRTYPVNGKFSPEQRDIYQLVLAALDAAIATVRPGVSWNSMYPAAMEVLVRGLLDLKLLQGSYEQAMDTGSYEKFTLHKTGHFMGLDVHDVGSYRKADGDWVTLVPNMIFTIEPGLYFPKGMPGIDPRWQGMGVRIEDDILVTTTGNENLSGQLPRTIADIEALMAEDKL